MVNDDTPSQRLRRSSLEQKSSAGEKEGEGGFSQQDYQDRVNQELLDVGAALGTAPGKSGSVQATWKTATDIVRRVRPVPWLLWNIIRSVFGKSGELGDPDPLSFSPISPLLFNAAEDKTLGSRITELGKARQLSPIVRGLGSDVAAALCFVHAVSRRVSSILAERVSRPILEDALLRTFIGYNVGEESALFGPGRGMIAGFSGRSGLAIQVASGDQEQAGKALSGLASGTEIGEVCMRVYGCDPLQVAALALISGGCNRDMALGIAAFNYKRSELLPETEQHRWFSAFEVIENLRMGRHAQIHPDSWRALGLDEAAREAVIKKVQGILRHGHGWRWLVKPLVTIAAADEVLKNKHREEREKK